MSEPDYFDTENEDVRRLFDPEAVLVFTDNHSVQIVRGSDYQYQLCVDGRYYAASLTPMGALVYGMKEFFSHEALRE